MEFIYASQAAEMCHVVNKMTKSLQVTKNYIEMYLLGDITLSEFYRDEKSPEKILWIAGVIDIMGAQYDLELDAMDDAVAWLIDEKTIRSLINLEEQYHVSCSDLRPKDLNGLLASAAQNIQSEIDHLYATKRSVLEIANAKGELELRGEHKAKKFWTKCYKWFGFSFHLPVSDRLTETLDNMYKDDMDNHKFVPRRNYCPYSLAEINKAKEVLERYIDQNRIIAELSATVKSHNR